MKEVEIREIPEEARTQMLTAILKRCGGFIDVPVHELTEANELTVLVTFHPSSPARTAFFHFRTARRDPNG